MQYILNFILFDTYLEILGDLIENPFNYDGNGNYLDFNSLRRETNFSVSYVVEFNIFYLLLFVIS